MIRAYTIEKTLRTPINFIVHSLHEVNDGLAQGRPADQVIIHADSRATNLVDQSSFYVGISRAKASATVFTNDRGKLISAITERAGQVQTAIAQMLMPSRSAGKAAGAGMG